VQLLPLLDHLGRSARVIHLFARERRRLTLPIRVTGPIALLDPAWRIEGNVQEFAPFDSDAIAEFDPEVAVGSLPALLSLAGRVDLSATVVLTTEPLTVPDRDRLWEAFRAPVFEHLHTPDGETLARECEVHGGLHLEPGATPPPRTRLIADQCECGLDTPRLCAETVN
jgi:hypothetical protein